MDSYFTPDSRAAVHNRDNQKGGGRIEMNKETDTPDQGFDPWTLAKPAPCQGNACHTPLGHWLFETTGKYIILP